MEKIFVLRKKRYGDQLPSSLKRLEYNPTMAPIFETNENNIKYQKYSHVINKIGLIPKLKSLLTKKDIVELDAEDLIKEMGFKGRMPQSILTGLRYILYPEGIKVRYHSHKTMTIWDKIFIFEKI